MDFLLRCFAICFAMAAMAGSESAFASPPASNQSLLHLERCMIGVLKKTPGVQIIKWYKPPHNMAHVQQFRFVGYSFHGNGILFEVEPSDGNYGFITALPTGLHATGAPLDPGYDWGTYELEKRWTTVCGADATTVIE